MYSKGDNFIKFFKEFPFKEESFNSKQLKQFKKDREICMNIVNSYPSANTLIDDPLCMMKEQKIIKMSQRKKAND